MNATAPAPTTPAADDDLSAMIRQADERADAAMRQLVAAEDELSSAQDSEPDSPAAIRELGERLTAGHAKVSAARAAYDVAQRQHDELRKLAMRRPRPTVASPIDAELAALEAETADVHARMAERAVEQQRDAERLQAIALEIPRLVRQREGSGRREPPSAELIELNRRVAARTQLRFMEMHRQRLAHTGTPAAEGGGLS